MLTFCSSTDVQWLRARFNECFDKAEYAKGRLVGDIPDSAMLAEKLIFDRALEMVRSGLHTIQLSLADFFL
jgi:hypothetical protein